MLLQYKKALRRYRKKEVKKFEGKMSLLERILFRNKDLKVLRNFLKREAFSCKICQLLIFCFKMT